MIEQNFSTKLADQHFRWLEGNKTGAYRDVGVGILLIASASSENFCETFVLLPFFSYFVPGDAHHTVPVVILNIFQHRMMFLRPVYHPAFSLLHCKNPTLFFVSFLL